MEDGGGVALEVGEAIKGNLDISKHIFIVNYDLMVKINVLLIEFLK